MACNCITTLDEKLKPFNTKLAVMFTLGMTVEIYPHLGVRQIEKGRGKPKPRPVVPTFCPFCGTRYNPEPAVAAYG